MPRSLTFQFGSNTFGCPLLKIDRSKLYGSIQVVTKDHQGEDTDLLSLARDGHTLIPYGGTAAGYVNKDGYWVETGERIPVDAEGDPLDLVESSFKAPIKLDNVVDEETLLDHPIRLTYTLDAAEAPEKLLQKMADGAIFHFGFSYRGGPVEDPAFLMTDIDGDLWLLIGSEAEVTFRDFKQVAVCAATAVDETEDTDENDGFDFDML